MSIGPIVQASVVEVLLRAVVELTGALDCERNDEPEEAASHYDRAAGLLLSMGMDIDTVEGLL